MDMAIDETRHYCMARKIFAIRPMHVPSRRSRPDRFYPAILNDQMSDIGIAKPIHDMSVDIICDHPSSPGVFVKRSGQLSIYLLTMFGGVSTTGRSQR
jgi:hypothetical protein